MHSNIPFILSSFMLSAAAMPTPANVTRRAITPSDEDTILQLHNNFRARFGSSPLTWDSNLQAGAQQWADSCYYTFHSPGSSDGSYGENIAGPDPSNTATVTQLVHVWLDEESNYDWDNPGFDVSPKGRTGHFTQVVWKATTKIGCGLSHNCGQTGLVCRYYPPGNYPGQFEANVPRALGDASGAGGSDMQDQSGGSPSPLPPEQSQVPGTGQGNSQDSGAGNADTGGSDSSSSDSSSSDSSNSDSSSSDSSSSDSSSSSSSSSNTVNPFWGVWLRSK